ncbi:MULTISPECIES: LysR family transcriptional regulator [Bradyrhizobium]|uniref:LysR family transcriptional regulator n=1 Tax=Bradyrhizobium TaxID=374 RepID=UPI00067ED478|nr:MULTISPECIES: LysR family transcriptional regulator [Bradyrhizobium]PAY06312.1 LysR family transcriptional regulator [Bradyrhizobium sp. UFLA03-84]
MDWDDLRFFAELVRQGNLSATARRLRADHSTVARRIDSLERALKIKLFDRLPRGYVLTAEGERIAERVGSLEEAVFSIQRLEGGEAAINGRVRISAPPAFASLWLVPRLAALGRDHPGLVLDVLGATAAASLARREADIALRLSRPEDSGLTIRNLGHLRYGIYGAHAYLDEVAEPDRVFLAYDEALDASPQQRWLRKFAGDRPIVMLANDLVSLISGARAGMGLAAVPHVLAADCKELRCVAESEEATRQLWLVYHPDIGRSARIRVVIDHLVTITQCLR